MSAANKYKRKVICIETKEIFDSVTAAKRKYGSHVDRCLSHTQCTAKQCHFKYLE